MKNIEYKKLSYFRTTVPIYKSQNEIRTILQKFGLQGERFTEYRGMGVIEFILLKDGKEMAFRFKFDLPEKEMHKRQVYRALFHYLKNRFMAIEFGITTVEEEFLQEMILKLPDGSDITVKELVKDQLGQLEFKSELLLPFKKEGSVMIQYCRHRWKIIEDYWDMGKHIIKYKCIDCSKEFKQIVGNKEMEDGNGKSDK